MASDLKSCSNEANELFCDLKSGFLQFLCQFPPFGSLLSKTGSLHHIVAPAPCCN